jgi:hypothetical protein
MPQPRAIRKVFRSSPVIEGAGVHLKRAFGHREAPLFDPFLMLDDFRNSEPALFQAGFPWHPHRGIETISYILRGTVEHGDSMGNKGVIGPGDVQWMTAGSGIVHQEMPKGNESGEQWGFQLWANLPASHKMMAPRYQEIKSAEIPVVTLENGVEIRVVCGEAAGRTGPVRDIVIEPQFLDITVPAGVEYEHPTPPGHTLLAYVIGGSGFLSRDKKTFGHEQIAERAADVGPGPAVENEHLVLFGPGQSIVAIGGDLPLRFLLFAGRPLNEPVAWRGPIVMNTEQELQTAFEEYSNGTFIKE